LVFHALITLKLLLINSKVEDDNFESLYPNKK